MKNFQKFNGTDFIRKKGWLMLVTLLLCIFIKSTFYYFFQLLHGDKGLQAIAALSIVEGYGYTIPEFDFLTDTIFYKPVIEWPPLYSLLLVPLLFLTNSNLHLSTFLADVAGVVTFFLLLIAVLKKLKFPVMIRVMIMFYQAFELNMSIMLSFPTDIWATASCLGVIYSVLKYLERPSDKNALILGITCCMPFLFRYMYLPIAYVVPFCILIVTYRLKTYPIRHAIMLFLVTGLLTALLLGYNFISTGQTAFIFPTQKGFYPENIKAMAPVFWSTFINSDFYFMQFSLLLPFSYREIENFFRVTGLCLMIFMTWIYFRKYFQAPPSDEPFDRFCFYGGALSISITFLLLILSLSRSGFSDVSDKGYWTFTMEERYFNFAMLFIMIFTSWLIFINNRLSYRLRKFLQFFFITLFAIEVVHGLYVLVKTSRLSPGHYSVYIESTGKRLDFLNQVFRKERAKGNEVILLTDQYGYIAHGIMNNMKVSRQLNVLQQNSFSFPKSTVLLVALPGNKLSYYFPLLNKHRMEQIHSLDDYYLFRKSYNNK